MKNKLKKYIILVFLIACLVFTMTACKKEPLQTPDGLVLSDEEILSWEKIEGADRYVVSLNDKEYETTDTQKDLFNLMTVPGVYRIKVMAFNDKGEYLFSEWSSGIEYEVFSIGDAMMGQRANSDGLVIGQVVDKSVLKGKIIIPRSRAGKDIVEIYQELFKDCTQITGIFVPDSVLTIGQRAFSGCTSLTRVRLPIELDTIETGLFSECSSLKSIVMHEGIKTVNAAFRGCVSLESIRFPASVTKINASGLLGTCTGLKEVVVDDQNTVFKSDGNCIIKISDNSLISGCSSSVIPNYVESIGDGAFISAGLKTISFPSSVKTIGERAFLFSSINSVVFPEGLTTLGAMAFGDCTQLTSVDIPSTLTNVGHMAFAMCTSLKTVVVSTNLSTIGTFLGCTALEEVIVSEGVTTLSGAVFEGCPLKKASLPASLTSILNNPFAALESFDGIKIHPDNTHYKIEGNCIIDIQNNSVVAGSSASVIPDYVTEIGENAFLFCTIDNLVLPVGLKKISDKAFFLAKIKSINLPNGLLSIGEEAFGCDPSAIDMTQPPVYTLTIPDSVVSVGRNAFGQFVALYVTFDQSSLPAGWHQTALKYCGNCYYGVGVEVEGGYVYVSSFFYDNFNKTVHYDLYTGIPTRVGFTFVGWTTTQGGTMVEYGVEERTTHQLTRTYTFLKSYRAEIGDKTLYAIWVQND